LVKGLEERVDLST